MRRREFTLLLGSALLPLQTVAAEEAPPHFLSRADVDLKAILPPPFARDSAETKAEIADILVMQTRRTPEMEAQCKLDREQTLFRFLEGMGIDLPLLKAREAHAFFKTVQEEAAAITGPAQDAWNRARPSAVDSRVKPVLPPPANGSYPAGHAAFATVVATLLGIVVPKRRADFVQRGLGFAENQWISGVHYRSDIDAGRTAGTAIAKAIMENRRFKVEFEGVATQLAKALG